MKVFIVEDEEAAGRGLQALLELDGYDVTLACSSAEARELAAGASYDVALLDVILPDGDGRQLIPVLRDASPTMKIYLATGSVSLVRDGDDVRFSDLDQEARALGADGYISKPIDYPRLRELLESSAS